MKYVIYDEQTIRYSPYGTLVPYPPEIWHRSTFFKIMYVVDKSIRVHIRSRMPGKDFVETISVGDTLIITPQDLHRYDTGSMEPGYLHRDVYVSSERMRTICDSLKIPYDKLTAGQYPIFFRLSTHAINLLEELLSRLSLKEPTPVLDQIHIAAAHLLLCYSTLANMKNSVYPVWMSQLVQNLTQMDFLCRSIEDIVASTNYSHGYVCRVFRQYTGVTLKSYVTKLKLERSKTLLINSANSIESIAGQLGFGTASHFTCLFRQSFALTPSHWRKQYASTINMYPNRFWGKVTEDKIQK